VQQLNPGDWVIGLVFGGLMLLSLAVAATVASYLCVEAVCKFVPEGIPWLHKRIGLQTYGTKPVRIKARSRRPPLPPAVSPADMPQKPTPPTRPYSRNFLHMPPPRPINTLIPTVMYRDPITCPGCNKARRVICIETDLCLKCHDADAGIQAEGAVN